MGDLWPDSITADSNLNAPVNILITQGSFLSKRTDGLVSGKVETTVKDNSFEVSFYLCGEVVDYRYKLLVLCYSVNFWPLDIAVGETIIEELGSSVKLTAIPDEEQFLETLEAIFATERAKRVIDAIVSYAQTVTQKESEEGSNG